MRPEERSGSSSDLRCILCDRGDETRTTGPLSCKHDIAAHQNCLLFSSGIYCKSSPTFDDLFGFDVEDVIREIKRGKKLKCNYCKRTGATAGCEVKSCKRSYHYPCAEKAQAVTEEDEGQGTFRLYCVRHNPHASNIDSEEGDGKVTPSCSGRQRSERNEQDSSRRESEPSCTPLPVSPGPSCSVVSSSTKSGCETPFTKRSNNMKRKLEDVYSDSDETDPGIPPIESDCDDAPPKRNRQTLDSGSSGDEKNPLQEAPSASNGDGGGGGGGGDDEACQDLDLESQSLLPSEYRQENVPFNVLADSGPSIESIAENSPEPCFSPADAALSNLDQSVSAPEQAPALHFNSTVPPNPPVPDSPPSGAPGETSNTKEASCGDLPVKPERCASRNLPPLEMPDERPGSCIKRSRDDPLDLTAPGGCCVPHVTYGEHADHAGVSDSGAAIFWRRCNEVGCTDAIFAELTRQLADLAEKVQNQHATQKDYAVSLRILEASGTLPGIFRQLEQDFEDQERQLQRKREALRDAKAALDNQLI